MTDKFDTGKIKKIAEERKEALHEKAEEEVVVRGRKLEKGDIFKFAGLIAFFALMVLICVLLWPYFHDLFEPGGLDRIINDVRGAGPVGFLILLGLQFLQIVVAFIPGEVVQVAAGMLYGPWIGALFILIGCVLSSAFIFGLVHKLGAPFVQGMVPTQYLEKFRRFERSGKLNIIVFILFLIPGLPKDVFTYLVPLTDMRMRTFLLLSNVGRIPGIIVSTYAADGLVEGRIVQSVIIFAVAAVIAILGIVFRERIMKLLERHSHNDD
ncbi:TVP38/TMEM64 family protein [Arabiibacter massiliensis]|uniref:TVP38/TMEM64 family protein n=1 Tax=Arabiibacter massiliensis TaxID=1870985 RepID=UPI001E2D5C6F|nr:VTT domain-containing protein [Arabiibacter massiliensis]